MQVFGRFVVDVYVLHHFRRAPREVRLRHRQPAFHRGRVRKPKRKILEIQTQDDGGPRIHFHLGSRKTLDSPGNLFFFAILQIGTKHTLFFYFGFFFLLIFKQVNKTKEQLLNNQSIRHKGFLSIRFPI